MNDILHLNWRAGFGLSPEEWQVQKNWSRRKAIQYLFREAKQVRQFKASLATGQSMLEMNKEARKEKRVKDRQQVALLNTDWLKRMGNPQEPALLERMSLFWHGHFACKIKTAPLATQQLNAIRSHALGNFRDLLLAIAKDVAMIRFLNNQQNRKGRPNENFARELLELFTMGRGHYSEKDIKEAARAFTGWSSNLKGEYVFRSRQHDYGKKIFLGKTGDFNGEDIIDIILEQRETARFICQKIYCYFVNETPDSKRIDELAARFYTSNYEIEPLMRFIFESDWFYDKAHKGAKIKSPVDLVAGILRSLNVQFKNNRALIFVERALGQILFDPPNVAGWNGGRAWIDNSTLMLRLNLPGYLLHSGSVNFKAKDSLESKVRGAAFKKLMATVDLQVYQNQFGGLSNQEIFEQLAQLLLQCPSSIDRSFAEEYARKAGLDDYVKACLICLMSLPEYQMC